MPDFDRKHALISIADVDYAWLRDILVALHGGAPSNWAILCVCFKDDPVSLPPLDHHRKLFTSEGAGTMNMVEFFRDMSHGQVDVGASKVFGCIDWTVRAATTSATSTRNLAASSTAMGFWTRQRP